MLLCKKWIIKKIVSKKNADIEIKCVKIGHITYLYLDTYYDSRSRLASPNTDLIS
jgi:hypothetical protein